MKIPGGLFEPSYKLLK
uniref:Uncharacterized protein n=1 Tax=Anguilla anguilla TaxID=7936 RepID=A0A0E9TXR7_ANGAN